MTDRYRDATALRRALEVRLKQQAADTATDLARRRRLVVFDRVAARLSADPAAGWVLKGGTVMEFRLHGRARTTKDWASLPARTANQDFTAPLGPDLPPNRPRASPILPLDSTPRSTWCADSGARHLTTAKPNRSRKTEMSSTKKKAAVATTSRARLASVIKSARDTMRKDAGLNGDLDRLPQLSWLLFLKAFDQRVEQVGPLLDPDYRPAIEKPYRWEDWATKPDFSGNELKTFVNDELIPHLAGLKGADGDAEDPRNVLSTIFKDVNNRMQSGTLLRDLVSLVDEIHFDSSDDIHTMAFLYESILKEMRDAAGDSGEFYTPRPVNRFMVQQSFLKLGESILDPACGTGGFLVQAYEDLVQRVETVTQRRQLHDDIRGIEKKSLPYLLASMNLLLHGIGAPRLVRENALLQMRDATAADRVDVVLTNPPFGGEEERSVVEKFPKGYQTQETSWLFLHAILDQLKKGGRCAIVLPNGSLFASGENSIGARIKQKLMKECNLHTIVRLPQGVFAPYTQIPSNLLFFEKGRPTEEVWFYEIPLPEGRRGYTKTKPMRVEEFDPCVEWWGGEKREGREEDRNAWRVSAIEVEKGGFNLDIPNPRIGEDLTHRPPEELMNELIKTESEILGLLEKLREELGGAV